MSTPRATFVFAGGGTGGHIYPALAVARALRDLTPDPVVRFLVSQRPLDAAILTRELPAGGPWTFQPIPAQPFSVRPLAFYRFVTRWGEAVRSARDELRAAKQQGPVVLGAFGGFVAAPAVQAARVERVPALLVNLDAVPGKANRWIAGRVRRVLTASRLAPGCERPGWEVIPPIVRPEALAPEPPARCRASFDLDPERPTLLVTGGSQGAGSINALLAALAALPESPLRAWQVIHQTGAKAADAAQSAYERAGVRAWVGEFIESMGRAWGAADLAICRAGAGNVAEAWANRVPCVFLPYPHHRDQHQAHNPRALADAGGAVIAPDAIDPEANLGRHGDTLRALLTDHTRLRGMHEALGALGPADGAAQAARALVALVNPT